MRRSPFAAFARALVALFAVWTATPAAAHDIPTDVRVQVFVKAEGRLVHLLVRLPVASTANDIEWPASGILLNLDRIEPALAESGRWITRRIDLYEGERRLTDPRLVSARLSQPSDVSFASYDSALRHLLQAPLPASAEVVARQALVDVLLEYTIDVDRSRFAVDPRFGMAGLRTETTVRFLAPGAPERAFQFHDDPGIVALDPRWFQAARRFVADGVFHILSGMDHLLFLLCLVIPLRRLRSLVPVVTAFTVAHSVTLIASAYGMAPDFLWFPPLVETLIAASIVYMALENIITARPARRAMMAFGFGLVHGFGFSFALRDNLQFAGTHLLTALFSFNVGVEIGQLAVLLVAVPLLALVFRMGLNERMGTIVLSAIVAHTGWHWMLDRGAALGRYQYHWPSFDAAFFALALRWLIVAVALAALAWIGSLFLPTERAVDRAR